MTAQPFRSYAPDPREPALHELPSLRIADQSITLHLCSRRDDDGAWRGRLRFTDAALRELETAEILCGASEAELWQAFQGLREHHLRALYQSLV
jgi:hypothetical protein